MKKTSFLCYILLHGHFHIRMTFVSSSKGVDGRSIIGEKGERGERGFPVIITISLLKAHKEWRKLIEAIGLKFAFA